MMKRNVLFWLSCIDNGRHGPLLRLWFTDQPPTGWLVDHVPTLAEVIEGLPGVEWLRCGRYSWDICYAGHIVTANDLARAVSVVLFDFRLPIIAVFEGGSVLYRDEVRGCMAIALGAEVH